MAATKYTTTNPISQPLILYGMPANTTIHSMEKSLNRQTQTSSNIEITKRKEQRHATDEYEDKTPKKVFVKIAPKPNISHPQGFFNPLSYHAQVLNFAKADINTRTLSSADPMRKVETANHSLISTGKSLKEGDALPLIIKARPHCPSQLSAAITLSELAVANPEEGTTCCTPGSKRSVDVMPLKHLIPSDHLPSMR